MLTKEQYDYIKGFKPMIDMFVNHGQYVGGADPLFDYLESQGLTGGYPIGRNCQECTSGFLKFTNTMIKLYEQTNG